MFEIGVGIISCLLSAIVGLIIGIRIGERNKQIQIFTNDNAVQTQVLNEKPTETYFVEY